MVVLHGLYMSGFVMHPLCVRLEKSGFYILNLSYNTLSPDKKEIFEKIDDFINGEQSALVCHSMGGLIARAYLANQSEQSQHVKQVITLGTPHKGSQIAKHMHDKGLQALLKDSVEYLLAPNHHWPFNAKLYSIAGNSPIGLMPLLSKQGESDGTVLVNETTLTGMTEHKVFPLNHTTLIYSKKVMQYVIELLKNS